MKKLLDLLTKDGMCDVAGGHVRRVYVVEELRRYLEKSPEHLVLELHKKECGEYDMTIYVDTRSWKRGNRR